MSTIISRSHVGPWESSDFAWAVPPIVLLLLSWRDQRLPYSERYRT
jgi:hypothetical protein